MPSVEKLEQKNGIARPTVLKVFLARKVLPCRFSSALDDVLVALIERVLEIKQRDHQAGG